MTGTAAAARHGRVVAGDFRPHPLLSGPHRQTLANLLRPAPQVEFRRERWERPDGDFLDLGHAGTGTGPRVILLHGLTGGFDSKYLRGLARQLADANWRCVLMQFRGAGPEPNRLSRGYHQGDTGDMRDLVERFHAEEPGCPLFAVGWSLGGNVLLKYLGETGAGNPLAAAVAVSVPFELEPCAERLRTGISRVYQRKLMAALKDGLRRKAQSVQLPISLEAGLAARDFFEFDESVTAPLNGFASARDYYARCSSRGFLGRIERPTLIIHSADDPFMTPQVVPDASELAPSVTLERCESGGHVGFFASRRGLPYCWLEQRIPGFLQLHAR